MRRPKVRRSAPNKFIRQGHVARSFGGGFRSRRLRINISIVAPFCALLPSASFPLAHPIRCDMLRAFMAEYDLRFTQPYRWERLRGRKNEENFLYHVMNSCDLLSTKEA